MSEKENASASFVLYCDWEDIIADLTNEEVGQLFKAIFAYINHDYVENFNGRTGVGVAYKTMCKQIDINRKKYEQIVEKRKKAAQKRWEKQNTDMQMQILQCIMLMLMTMEMVMVMFLLMTMTMEMCLHLNPLRFSPMNSEPTLSVCRRSRRSRHISQKL